MKRKPRTYEELEQYSRKLEAENKELKSSIALLKRKAVAPKDMTGGSVEKYQAIFEHSPLAIMSTDKNGSITTCNDNASKLFGAPKEKLIGFSYKAIKNESMKAAIARALSGKRSHFEGEYLTVTGNVLTNMNANFSPSFAADGSVSGVIGIFEDITSRVLSEKQTVKLIDELQTALAEVKKLSGLLPICASCKNIRDDKGYWKQIETYISEHSKADFTHCVCPECAKKLYPEYYDEVWGKGSK